jgi:hypothetical protein
MNSRSQRQALDETRVTQTSHPTWSQSSNMLNPMWRVIVPFAICVVDPCPKSGLINVGCRFSRVPFQGFYSFFFSNVIVIYNHLKVQKFGLNNSI